MVPFGTPRRQTRKTNSGKRKHAAEGRIKPYVLRAAVLHQVWTHARWCTSLLKKANTPGGGTDNHSSDFAHSCLFVAP